ncbi:MAG: GTP pyrophosphokinase [Clostridiales bacterium]|nr:MAG: GTP pyrophosphokinase [Clostridiales bacterium]
MNERRFVFNDEKFLDHNDFYGSDLILLEGVITELLSRFELIRRYKTAMGERDPIEYCKARIKEPESVCRKLEKYELPKTAEAAFERVYDAAGVRVICTFIDDVYTVVEMLRKHDDIEIIREKDYIKNPKENGYRSYHIIVKLPVRLADGIHRVFAEIQIRTIAMDCWAALEHRLKYKKEIKNQEIIVSELKRCASEIASTDMTLQTIRELIDEEEIT